MTTARKKKAMGKTLSVRQVRSGIGFSERQKATLRALGLSRPGKVRVLPDTRQVRGMLSKVPHLVEVEPGKGGER